MMALCKKVYVYNGLGISETALSMLTSALKRHLDHTCYDVCYISPEEIIEGEWTAKAAMLAIGGGYDLGFIKALTAKGIERIRYYVQTGGRYLGLCAGGYFPCGEIEFDRDGPLDVCGERHLKFFPGVGIGPVYPGFAYNTENGTVAAPITYNLALPNEETRLNFRAYFNGGCCFLPYSCVGTKHFKIKIPKADLNCDEISCTNTNDTHGNIIHKSRHDSTKNMSLNDRPSLSRNKKRKQDDMQTSVTSGSKKTKQSCSEDCFIGKYKDVEILGYYSGIVGNPAAIVKCNVGDGCAVLSGVHIEYDCCDLCQTDPNLVSVLPQLQTSDLKRQKCLVSLLKHLGLRTVSLDKIN